MEKAWHQMRRKENFILFFTLLIGATFYHMLWIDRTEPFIDRDAINQTWYPIKNLMSAWQVIPMDWGFFTSNLFNPKYPTGILALSIFNEPLMGKQLLAQKPILLSLNLIWILATLPFLTNLNTKQKVLYFLLISSFPCLVLSYRGFSLFGFNVIFAFTGSLFYFMYLRFGARLHLIAFVLCFSWSAIIKQLGLVYLLILGLVSICHLMARKKILDLKELLFAWSLIILICFNFYNPENIYQYLQETLLHNASWSSLGFAAVAITMGFMVLFMSIVFSKCGQLLTELSLEKNLLMLASLLIWMLLLCLFCSDAESGLAFLIVSIIIFILWIPWFYYRFDLQSVETVEYLYILLLVFASSILYCSALGHSIYNFFLPAALIFHKIVLKLAERIEDNYSTKILLAILSLNLFFGQFFPSLNFLEKTFGVYGANIYVNGLNTVVTNPLSWINSGFKELREQIQSELEKIILRSRHDNAIYLIEGAHFYTRLALEYKLDFNSNMQEIYRLHNIPPAQREPLREDFFASKEELIRDWVNHYAISYILIIDEPYTKVEGDPPLIENFVDLGSKIVDQNGFLASLTKYGLKRMQIENFLQKHFISLSLPANQPKIRLLIRKGLESDKLSNSNKFSFYLSDFCYRYWQLQAVEELPSFYDKLHEDHQHEIKEFIAGAYFGKASHYLDRFEYFRAYKILRKAYDLSPNKKGLIEDLKLSEKSMPTSHWRILEEEGYKPLFKRIYDKTD